MQEENRTSKYLIRKATEADIDFCIALERDLHPDLSDAADQGFLLQGAKVESYQDFLDGGYVLIAERSNRSIGFLVALPRAHSRIQHLLSLRDSFALESVDLLDIDDLVWIAKIAVRRDSANQGCGKALAKALIDAIGERYFMTATLIEPVCNKASMGLCESLGFNRVGTFASGDHGKLEECLSAIYLRIPQTLNSQM